MNEGPIVYSRIAGLKNVAAMTALVKRVEGQIDGLPGMACFYGFSGYGKSTAAIYAANKFHAVVVQMESSWTTKPLCQAILTEMSIRPRQTVADMVKQIAEGLAVSGRPLFIDEADYLVQRNMVEIVRDIYEKSGATTILIGEEMLPQQLRRWERVHGRMCDWVQALPGDMDDLRALAPIYCPGVEVDQSVLDLIYRASTGSVRRYAVNLRRVHETAMTLGLQRVDAAKWGKREFFQGVAPEPRRDADYLPRARRR